MIKRLWAKISHATGRLFAGWYLADMRAVLEVQQVGQAGWHKFAEGRLSDMLVDFRGVHLDDFEGVRVNFRGVSVIEKLRSAPLKWKAAQWA